VGEGNTCDIRDDPFEHANEILASAKPPCTCSTWILVADHGNAGLQQVGDNWMPESFAEGICGLTRNNATVVLGGCNVGAAPPHMPDLPQYRYRL
jgi:hypothetical protein